MESVTIESSCSNSHRTESELQSPIKYGNFEDISSTLQETISSNKDWEAAPNADTSKKRRKKKEPKKSSGDEDKSSYGALDADNILHFEDDDEFPGLLKSLNDNQQKTAQVMSMYSDILKSVRYVTRDTVIRESRSARQRKKEEKWLTKLLKMNLLK
ncbi:hypothetical protein ScPMuIL_003213 [Solemya velum]